MIIPVARWRHDSGAGAARARVARDQAPHVDVDSPERIRETRRFPSFRGGKGGELPLSLAGGDELRIVGTGRVREIIQSR
jgi:hypothetical protein